MIIQETIEKMKASTGPVTAVLHKNEHFKVILLGLKKGLVLKEHKTEIRAKISVIFGSVNFKLGEEITPLKQYETLEIPVNEYHSVTALEDSLCMITKG